MPQRPRHPRTVRQRRDPRRRAAHHRHALAPGAAHGRPGGPRGAHDRLGAAPRCGRAPRHRGRPRAVGQHVRVLDDGHAAHRRHLPARADAGGPALPRLGHHGPRARAARHRDHRLPRRRLAAAAGPAVVLARHPRVRGDPRHSVLHARRCAVGGAARAGAARARDRGRRPGGSRAAALDVPDLEPRSRTSPTASRSSASSSGPSPSSPARSGRTTRGAATGAGTPRRCGRSSSG